MSTKNLNKSLKQIFQSKYIVPLYQRNYAWGQDEIEQLLQDLYENFKKSKTNPILNYFIGSLVVLKRNDGLYEVIDGQQRLTTLSLLLKILNLVKEPKLFYESRPEVESFFDSYYRNGKTTEVTFDYKVSHLINAVDLLQQSIVNPDEDIEKRLYDIEGLEQFRKFVFENVVLVRIEIPQDTDVANYFEIMNNRGEQLQKHEILKSYLIETLKDKDGNYFEKQQDEFSKIWDACSQMDTHIQKLFSSEERRKYFGENYDHIRKVDFEDEESYFKSGFSINQALENTTKKLTSVEIEDIDDSGKDQSIIDFPNFLMHIFKVKYQTYYDNGNETEIPLNEKDLITVYESLKNIIDAKDFVNDLLYYRTVFDRFIVKSTDDDRDEESYKWTLKKPTRYDYSKVENKISTSLKYKNSYNDQERLIKSISLLQVTFRNRKYKNWLQEILNFFSDRERFNIENIKLQSFVDKIILNHFDGKIDSAKFDEGVKVPHFLFNFIDYLYWVQSPSDFKFTYRNSVEHHLPQSYKNEINESLLDNLGNLCLVSKSSNSKMNNEHPTGKAAIDGKYYKTNLPPKQKIIYDITNRHKQWGNEEISNHRIEVADLLENRERILIISN
ncbi:DUF262 domain-containing protein [Epilithonimonas zeae]|uniref:DUF262 domain-containing protein n=1 Tax=Epilithonimonas zeae TaxID=1416779 RepID=A0A1N6GNC8_9FLAO|nr:DUF262 domain-containing protein [Epilithonimonas zeae]SIO09050.1 Protein of unknown function [Epilithonimonas zeae]